jgi:hypothetical protein
MPLIRVVEGRQVLRRVERDLAHVDARVGGGFGDLVISSRASRHPEEQNGEVSAFMIGETCFAWWSNDQLRQLAERRKAERESMREEWSRVAKKEPPPKG